MKSSDNFQIVKNMKAYILDDIHNLQKREEDPFTNCLCIDNDHVLSPDLKSMILNQSDFERINQEGQPYDETYSKSVKSDSLNKLFIFEEQFLNIDSNSSEQISDEF